MGIRGEFLKLLKEDEEFRYTVLGYLGIADVLKRLDSIAEEQKELRKEQGRIWKEIEKTWEEIRKFREEQTKIWKEIERLREEQAKVWEEMRSLRGEQIKILEEMRSLRGEQIKILEEMRLLRLDFSRMDVRLGRVERTLEKLTLDIEDEGRSVVRHRLREMGVNVELGRLQLPDLEVDIYGVSDDLCVVGETSVRAGVGVLDELYSKLHILEERYPAYLRPRRLLLVYCSLAMPELVERARRESVWVVRATEDITQPPSLLA
ncbi:MAG: hypothetical protein NXY59_01650 [Aigarchaeota archaeon]|nr:hypothetical protein [Candidatus Pelearchaeum maunauluense]